MSLGLKREIIVFLGAKQVGKSTLIKALFPSINVNFKEPRFFRDYMLEENRYVREVCCRDDVFEILAYSINAWKIFAALLIFDITRKSSLYVLEKWHRLIPEGIRSILVGNKIDLPDKEIKENDVTAFANRLNIMYCLVSATTGEGLDRLRKLIFGEELIEKVKKEKEVMKKALLVRKEYLPIPLETSPSRSDLTDLEIKILDLVDGKRTVHEIAKEVGMTPHSVIVFLKRLHAKGKIKDIEVVIM